MRERSTEGMEKNHATKMAEKFERGGKFQIVFLVDIYVKEQSISAQDLENIYDLKLRAISLCVLRLLLHFNSVCENGNIAPLKWGFKFYNSNVLNFEYKRRRFYELNGESFEKFEEEMKLRFTNACNGQSSSKTEAGVKSLTCSLTEILHDFPWTTPDISSPSRSVKHEQFNSQDKRSRNYLFVIGECPLSDIDVRQFLGRNDSSFNTDVVFKEMFSEALYKEFYSKCGLSLFWIDSGPWCVVPEKLKNAVEDWTGYILMSSLTKQHLDGNICPISVFTQDTRNISVPHLKNSTSSSKGSKLKSETLVELQVIASTFKFSFGRLVKQFLSGKDMVSESTINHVQSSVPSNNVLLKGMMHFQEKRVCCVALSHISQNKLINPLDADCTFSHEENCFVLKAVIASSEVSPSWMHPTKLYSCFSEDTLHETESQSTAKQMKQNCMFLQMLTLVSGKSLTMVVEYKDPESSAPVTGILQPVTSFCAILSMVKQDKLLLVEKALLQYKSHGYILVPCDVTPEDDDSEVLPFYLKQCQEECRTDEKTASKNGISDKLSRQNERKDNKKKIIDSYILNFQKKTTKEKTSEKELHLKLKDYYLMKKSKSNSKKVQAPMVTRGKLLQETSQKNQTSKLSESDLRNNVIDSTTDVEDSTATLSNLDSEQTDVMDEDFVDLSVIQNVEDLKKNLLEGYSACLDQKQSIAVYVNRAFQVVEHFHHSGQLKDNDEIDALLKSTVVRDGRSSRETESFLDAQNNDSNNERVVTECKLQVFLRLEFADKIGVVDEEKVADKITSVLRMISFKKDPAYLNTFLKNSIIPRYAGNLSSLLRQLYDGLMQRPPKEIRSPSQVTSEEDTPLKSRLRLSSSKKAKSVEEAHSESSQSSRTLVRRHSVVGLPAKRREIVVPFKGKSDKTRKKAGSAGKKSGKKSHNKKPVTPVKKVRRNLFEGNGNKSSPTKQLTKTASKSERNNLSRRHLIPAKKVAETPVGKQVSHRMLRRQEWARRRSKTVTDITIVEESPRKSPRQNAARFYSASQRASSSSKTTSKSFSTAGECLNEDNTVLDNKSSVTLHRTQSLNIDTVSSPRSKYTKLLNIDKSSSCKTHEGDSFAEVFLETSGENETNILSACTSDTLSTVPSKRSVSRRSNSSPLLLSTPPPKPSKSPVISHKSIPTTSPVLFKTPKTTPKSSPINFSPDQIFDIAIPLTPVKSPLVKLKKTDAARNSYLRASPLGKSEVSKNFGEQSGRVGPKSNLKRPDAAKNSKIRPNSLGKCGVITSPSENIDTPSIVFVEDSLSVEIRSESVGFKRENAMHDLKGPVHDLENIVAASPLTNRKRSLISSTKSSRSKTLNFGKRNFSRCSEFDSSSDIRNEGTAEVEKRNVEFEKEVFDQSQEFESPVATKRKKSTRTENGSPLNQILKQRKKSRNTPPGKKYWVDHRGE